VVFVFVSLRFFFFFFFFFKVVLFFLLLFLVDTTNFTPPQLYSFLLSLDSLDW